MKILHIFSGDGGGVSTYVKNLIKEKDSDVEFYLLSFTKYGPTFQSLKNDIDGLYFFTMPRPKLEGKKNFIVYLINFFKNYEFDIIYSHMSGVYGTFFKIMSYINGNNLFFVHIHQTTLQYGEEENIKSKIYNKVFPYLNRIISNHRIACGIDAAVFGFGTYDEKKTTIIYNSVEAERFYSNYNNTVNNNKIVLGHIGTHTAAKNLEFILELASFIKMKNLDMEIHMFGDGELTSWLTNEVNYRDLNQYIKLRGRKNNIEEYYKKIDILLLPSYSEGLPTVVIESQATGTPVILSNTITKEVDLDLGLLKFLPIEITLNTMQDWIDTVNYLRVKEKPPLKLIKEKIEEKEFTTKKMYEKFKTVIIGAN